MTILALACAASVLLGVEEVPTLGAPPHRYAWEAGWLKTEHLGNTQRSLELLAEAYQKARGPASRFQWGYQYLDGLLLELGIAGLQLLDPGLQRIQPIEDRIAGRLGRLDLLNVPFTRLERVDW